MNFGLGGRGLLPRPHISPTDFGSCSLSSLLIDLGKDKAIQNIPFTAICTSEKKKRIYFKYLSYFELDST